MKLIYNGSMASGRLKLPDGGEIEVVRGSEYDIPDNFCKDLVDSGLFLKPLNKEEVIDIKVKKKAKFI